MIRKSAIATTTLLLLLLAVPLTWAQERAIRPLETNNRQALVIGNANYAHAGVLRNPANDAKAIGRTLEQLGFKVTTLTDADERQMDQAIRNFGRQLRGSNGVGLFYYAGHGMQIEGQNYLLPTDINPSNEFDVTYDAVPVGKLLGQMQVAENGMNIVILDACRNNPFARNFRSSSRGLAQVIAPTGSFISYATAPGNVAADGGGDNGLFTEKLLQHMTTPGLRLEEVFKRVRADVQQDSNNKQVPWDSSSVTGDFFFVPADGVATENQKVVLPATSSDQDFAAQAWEIVKGSEDQALLEEFITLFPEAPQTKLAKLKQLALASKKSKIASSATQPETDINPVPENQKVTSSVPTNTSVLSGATARKKLLESKECLNCDLSHSDLYLANLEKANLQGANLAEVNLRGASLYASNLVGANLRRGQLSGANLREANLSDADLSGVDWSLSDLRNAKFCNTTMPDGTLNNQDCDKPVQQQSKSEVEVVLSGEAAKKKLLETKECVGCQLRFTNLGSINLRGAQLGKADLYEAYLVGAQLVGAKLIGSNLSGAELNGAELNKADLRDSNLTNTDLTGAKLDDALLDGAKFCNTNMPDGTLNNRDCDKPMQQQSKSEVEVVLSGEAAKRQVLEVQECVGCDFQGANLIRAGLQGANLSKSNLSKSDVSYANLRNTNFQSADLRNTNLMGANLENTNFQSADLRNTNLMGANLGKANLEYANLEYANLMNANLMNANLQSVDLRNANLWSANFQSADLRNTNLWSADLRNADLYKANLKNAKIYSTHLNKIRLGEDDLREAEISSARFCNTTMPDGTINNDDC